jgi:tetratricopeptide (TPR) repeat protein
VRVLATRANFYLAVDDAEEALGVAGEALQMANELELDELRAHTLSTLGFSRVMTGDLDGLRDLRESVDVAAAANSPQAARGYNNLASITADLGDLTKAFELYAESRRVAERFGDAIALRWLDVEHLYELYWRGDWDGALALGESLLADSDEDAAALHGLDVLLVRGKIALGREGAGRALEDAEHALELARAVGAPQILLPVLAFDAHALASAGRAAEAGRAADELMRLWLEEGRGLSLASFWLADVAFALADLGRAEELVQAAGRTPTRTRWLEATEAAGEGDWPRAAGVYARIGSLPDEALARFKAAGDLAAADRPAEADEELRRATAFYRDVGAAAYAVADR